MKGLLVQVDKAGRIMLPDSVCRQLAIRPGDLLRVSVKGGAVTLTPKRPETGLIRRGRALVFSTGGDEALTAETVRDLIEDEREERRQSAGPRTSIGA